VYRARLDERKIDALFADLDQCHHPGAAVGIAIDGRPVYRKGFGLASLELPMVLTPATRMRIGSTTKHFTCLAYLLLCEDGKAGIDDPVSKFLPELNPVARHVTMRQLMGNTSGLRDAIDLCFQFSGLGAGVTNAQLVGLYRDVLDANAAPGTSFCYNNGGFCILTEVIERIAGRSLEEVLRNRIFDRVGMYDTLLRRRDSNFVSNSATAHMTSPAGEYERWYWMDHAGHGGMVSTVDDMLRWLAHMSAPVVGSSQTWAAMRSPQRLANGASTGYGLGLKISSWRGLEVIEHGGGWLGASCQMLKIPAAGLSIVLLDNSNCYGLRPHGAMVSAHAIIAACVEDVGLQAAPRDAAPLARGIYYSPETGRSIQLYAEEGRQVGSVDGNPQPFHAVANGDLVADHWDFRIVLPGEGAMPAAIRFIHYGNVEPLEAAAPVPTANPEALLGRYRCDATGDEATILDKSGRAYLATVGRFGSTLKPLESVAKDLWRADSPNGLAFCGGMLVTDPDGRGFRYSTLQTWGLSFRRVD